MSAVLSFVISVRLSARNSSYHTGRIFMKFRIGDFYYNPSKRKNKFHSNWTQVSRILHEELRMSISLTTTSNRTRVLTRTNFCVSMAGAFNIHIDSDIICSTLQMEFTLTCRRQEYLRECAPSLLDTFVVYVLHYSPYNSLRMHGVTSQDTIIVSYRQDNLSTQSTMYYLTSIPGYF
jgi:hypothetical protein